MLLSRLFNFVLWAELIEFMGALLIVGYVVAALLTLLRGRGIRWARLLTTDGVLYALSFKVAGTLIRTIELQSWQQILMFTAILALRTALKYVFQWEKSELARERDVRREPYR